MPAELIEEETKIVSVDLKIDIGTQSSMFQCKVCFELIQYASKYRQCARADCECVMCTDCLAQMNSKKCPYCRNPTQFIVNTFIVKHIYPRLTTTCSNQGCAAKYLFVGDHARKCRFRTVTCPICFEQTPIAQIHEHIRMSGKCRRTWREITYDKFWTATRQSYASSYNLVICLNMDGTSLNRSEARRLYIWYEEDVVRMILIQLCASADEWLEYARDPSGTPRMIQVAHMENFDEILPTIDLPDELRDCKIALGAGLHRLSSDTYYQVRESDDYMWRVALIVETIWNPPRAIFVDVATEQLITINVDATMHDRIANLDDPRIEKDNKDLRECKINSEMANLVRIMDNMPYLSMPRLIPEINQEDSLILPSGHANIDRIRDIRFAPRDHLIDGLALHTQHLSSAATAEAKNTSRGIREHIPLIPSIGADFDPLDDNNGQSSEFEVESVDYEDNMPELEPAPRFAR